MTSYVYSITHFNFDIAEGVSIDNPVILLRIAKKIVCLTTGDNRDMTHNFVSMTVI